MTALSVGPDEVSECGEVVREELWSDAERFFVDLELCEVDAGVVKVDGIAAVDDISGEILVSLDIVLVVFIPMKAA